MSSKLEKARDALERIFDRSPDRYDGTDIRIAIETLVIELLRGGTEKKRLHVAYDKWEKLGQYGLTARYYIDDVFIDSVNTYDEDAAATLIYHKLREHVDVLPRYFQETHLEKLKDHFVFSEETRNV